MNILRDGFREDGVMLLPKIVGDVGRGFDARVNLRQRGQSVAGVISA